MRYGYFPNPSVSGVGLAMRRVLEDGCVESTNVTG